MAKINMYEQKVNELEEELSNKREALALFVYQYTSDTYGATNKLHKAKRDAVLDVFAEVYANWEKI